MYDYSNDMHSTSSIFPSTGSITFPSGAHSLKPALKAGFDFNPNGKVEPFYSQVLNLYFSDY
jgi:hypothetical protein